MYKIKSGIPFWNWTKIACIICNFAFSLEVFIFYFMIEMCFMFLHFCVISVCSYKCILFKNCKCTALHSAHTDRKHIARNNEIHVNIISWFLQYLGKLFKRQLHSIIIKIFFFFFFFLYQLCIKWVSSFIKL